jgi:hypothetical protein
MGAGDKLPDGRQRAAAFSGSITIWLMENVSTSGAERESNVIHLRQGVEFTAWHHLTGAVKIAFSVSSKTLAPAVKVQRAPGSAGH